MFYINLKNFFGKTVFLLFCLSTKSIWSRVENLKRDSLGAVTDVFDLTEPDTEASAGSYAVKFANFNDEFQGERTSFFDASRNQVFVAKATSAGNADRSLMVAFPATQADGTKILQLSSLTPAGHFLNGASFYKIEQSADKIVAVTNENRHQINIVDKATGSVVTTTVLDGGGQNGKIDNFIVVDDKIVVAVFDDPNLVYNNNANGRIKVLNLAGVQVGSAKHPTTVQDLVVNTNEGSFETASPDNLTTICGSKALTKIGAMHWDKSLKRLFIAFSRNNNTLSNTNAMPFLVCRFSGNNLVVDGLTALGISATNQIATFKLVDGELDRYAIPHLATMTDLVQQKYLLANISYFNDADSSFAGNRTIFCLPVLSAGTATEVGKLAKPDFSGLATQSNDFYGINDVPALVGGGSLPVSYQAQITSMQVIGQTVFVSTSGNKIGQTFKSQEAGIWASTALFDSAGNIKGWTPWGRAVGVCRSVYAMHFDSTDASLWYLFDVGSLNSYEKPFGLAKTVLSSGNSTKAEGGLLGLAQKVKSGLGNIISAQHFPAVRTKGLGKASLTVFGGLGELMLASSGQSVGQAAGTNDQLEVFRSRPTGLGETVDLYNANNQYAVNLNLPEVGGIFCSEVFSTPTIANNSWLFLGTTQGLGVFSKSLGVGNDGAGWDATASPLTDLNNFAAPVASPAVEISNKMYYRALAGINEPVLQITGRSSLQNGQIKHYLYVCTYNNLYRIEVAQNKFKKIAPAALNPVSIFATKSTERIISLHLLPDSSCGYLLTSNDQTPDPFLPLRTQSKQRSCRLYQFNNLHQVAGVSNLIDVSDKLGEIFDVTKMQILPINQFNRSLTFPGLIPTIANIIVTAGSLSIGKSQIYCMPVFGTFSEDFNSLAGLSKNYFPNISETGVARLVSRLESPVFGSKLCLGTNLTGISYSYGSAHLSNIALLRPHAGTVDAVIEGENSRVVNSWIDSSTGSFVVAGSFGIKIQE